MLHDYIDGEKVGVDGRKIVDVDGRHNPCPGGTPAPPGERGREPPSFFFFFLGLPLDGRRVSPLVLGLHCGGRARAPPRLDLSPCFLLFLCSQILAFHRFLNSRRSVTLIGLKF